MLAPFLPFAIPHELYGQPGAFRLFLPPTLAATSSPNREINIATMRSLPPSTNQFRPTLSKSTRSGRGEELLGGTGAVGEREFEVLGNQLLNIWSLNVIGVGELNDLQDLIARSYISAESDLYQKS